jgi:hypothetical protein
VLFSMWLRAWAIPKRWRRHALWPQIGTAAEPRENEQPALSPNEAGRRF